MEELSSFPLTRAQKADYFHVHNRDFFQIQDDIGIAASHLVCNLAQMIRPRPRIRQCYLREKAALEFANGKLGIGTPVTLHAGEIEGWSYIVMTRLAGFRRDLTCPIAIGAPIFLTTFGLTMIG
jgi:hypothetical protein